MVETAPGQPKGAWWSPNRSSRNQSWGVAPIESRVKMQVGDRTRTRRHRSGRCRRRGGRAASTVTAGLAAGGTATAGWAAARRRQVRRRQAARRQVIHNSDGRLGGGRKYGNGRLGGGRYSEGRLGGGRYNRGRFGGGRCGGGRLWGDGWYGYGDGKLGGGTGMATAGWHLGRRGALTTPVTSSGGLFKQTAPAYTVVCVCGSFSYFKLHMKLNH